MDAADQIKALGDLEYRADLEPYLDPVSRYGFDPDAFQMGSQKKGFGPQAYSHYDRMTDTVNISESGLPSKSTQSHEYRHRGFAKLFKQYRKNPDFYEEKYPGIGGLLQELMGGRSGFNETITEFYDTDETYNLPAQYETTTPYSRGRTLGEDAGVVLARGRDYTDDPYVIERKDGLGMQVKKKTKQISGPARLDAGSPEELARRQNFIDYREQAPEDRDTENNLLFNKVLLLEQMAEDEYKNPQNFAQGGPVMRGIGTLNETARNMTRGPRGIGAYQQFASGGEAMGPPPTRGPDPQGIGYFQQFADGGPVYMQEGGDPFAEVDFDKLTAAVIQTESGGDPNAVSEDDAIGLMQVLPSTGAQPGYEQLGAQNVFDIAIDLGFPVDDSERTVEKARELLFNPKINVAFGTKYLRAMIAHSDGDIKRALQKYNTGTGNYQAFVEGRKPLDQEAVRYPVLVANALTGGNLSMPETAPFTPTTVQRGEDLIMSMPVAQSDAMSPLAIENRREGTEFQGQDAYSAGENLSRQTRQDFGSQAQQDDFEAMTPQNISMRERYSSPNMAAELVGGEEALEEGIGGFKKLFMRPKLRPPSVEFGEDKGGVFRSLMPPRRPKKEYPGNDTDALMRGLRGIRGRTLRKGFTPYVQDVRGELT